MSVQAGQSIPAWKLRGVSAERMKLLAAILRDPNPIHWDPAEVAKRGLGNRVINQGPTNLGYITNMLMEWAGPACLRCLKVRFTANVFNGDDVAAGGVVSAVSEHHGERLAECEVWLDVVGGARAVEGRATVVWARSGPWGVTGRAPPWGATRPGTAVGPDAVADRRQRSLSELEHDAAAQTAALE